LDAVIRQAQAGADQLDSAGRLAALEDLILTLYPGVLGYVSLRVARFTDAREIAEDVTQDVMTRLIVSLQSCRATTDAAVRAWATSAIAVGLCAAVLVWCVPPRWWWTGLIGGMVCVRHWWFIFAWKRQSPHFHQVALGLMAALPLAVLAFCAASEWLRRRKSGMANRGSAIAHPHGAPAANS